MAVDRGGLRYTISVEDKFSKQIARLKSQLKSLEGDLNRVSAARAKFSASQRRTVKNTDAATAATTREGAARATSGRKTVTAQRKNQKALRGTRRELIRVKKSADAAGGAVNRISFSFRRLIGILAVFQAARAGVGLFTNAITGGVRFNQTIEDSTIAMAALFTTAGRVFDAQGNMLTGQEAFNAALALSRDQIQKLRIDALGTTATFEELQRAFQGSIGPGFEAGLNVDQIRTFAVRISQAAAALTIAQNQLIEESRSFLRGTIQARTTLIASILGVSNEAVKAAIASGKQVEFFRDVLDGFRFSADATQKSFTGLAARLRDTFSQATGAAGEEFFDGLKVALAETSSLFVTLERDAKGAIIGITPNPNTVAVLRGVFDALSRGLETVQKGLRKIPIQQLLKAFIGLGAILEGGISLFTGFLRGGIEGFSILVSAVAALGGELKGLELQDMESMGRLLGLILTLLIGASVAAGTLVGLLKLAKSPLARMGLAIGLAVVGIKKIASEILGVNITFFETGELIKLTFATAFGTVVRQGSIIFKKFANALVGFFTNPMATIAGMLSTLLNSLAGAAAFLASVKLIEEGTRSSFDTAITKLQTLAAMRADKKEGFFFKKAELDKDQEELDRFLDKAAGKFSDFAAKVARAGANRDVPFKLPKAEDIDTSGIAAKIEGLASDIANTLNGIIGKNIIDIEGIKKAMEEVLQHIVKGAKKSGEETAKEGPLVKWAQNIEKNFNSGLNVIRQSATQFASFLSDIILDAFDPNKKVDLEERFASLFRGIVKVIINELVKLAVAKAILSILGPKGGADGGQVGKKRGGQIGFDEGGVVPGGHHATPQFRPAAVAKSDTVNAWLTPKEFVQPVTAVNKYGADLMELIRRGMIDPGALRAVAGLGNKRASRIVSGSAHRGYAAGGSISSGDVRDVQSATSGTQGGGQVVGAVIPGNDQTMDRLLQGGKTSMLDWIQENRSTIDGILSQNRAQ